MLIRLATPALAEMLPFTAEITLNLRIFALAGTVAIAVCLIAGTTATHAHTRRLIVIVEVALSLVVVSGALLLFKSLSNLQAPATGVRIENVTTMSVGLPLLEESFDAASGDRRRDSKRASCFP